MLTSLLVAASVFFQTPPPAAPSAANPDPNMPRPIAARDSVFLEELTWLEVRDAMRAGKTTAVVATGGIEQNGPYLALDKHQIVLRATTEAIARKLGNALVAPIVAFVPEGTIEPPSGHMRFPGTITLTDDTYKRLLTDIAASLRAHGFTTIVFIGDSGGNQDGMKEVAATLNAAWTDGKTRILFIPEYYDYPGVQKWLESQGVKQTNEGHHDDFQITAEMMVVDPSSVRLQERIAAGKASINGVPIAPAEKAIEWGKKIVDYRAEITVKAIREKLAQVRSSKAEGAREAEFLILDGASNVVASHRIAQERPVSCSYVTTPRETRVPKTGGVVSFTVVTEPADCRWTVEGGFSLLTISPSSGQGRTRVTLTAGSLNFDTFTDIEIWGLSRQNPPGKHRIIWGAPSELPPFSR